MSIAYIFLAVAVLASCVSGCTNVIVSPGASNDGSTMVAYNADSHVLYGALYHYPHAFHTEPTVDVYDWDSGTYLGKIAQVNETYNVIGNVNEYQVAIGETTFGGREELTSQPGALVDYGSLIYLALQRAKTAREAIAVMTGLVAKYGYYSEGESFSIVDQHEAWIMEMIGKGSFEMGAVWVAQRLPNGTICAHANQARITQFPRDDPENCVFSQDVVSFARARGYYNGADADFSFSDTYAPLTFDNVRGCEGRVYAAFRKATSPAVMDVYLDYITGKDLTHRMPLFITPSKPISVSDVMAMMADHYEGTILDFTTDVGAGPYGLPYRWRPLTWSLNNKNYFNERASGTQQTGFAFVAQLRSWLPDPVGALNWFGVDDASLTVRVPFYASITSVPQRWAKGYADMMNMKFDSAFYIFNMVNNFAYTSWNMIGQEVISHIQDYQSQLIDKAAQMDIKATNLYASDPKKAVAALTDFSNKLGDQLVDDWIQYFMFLFTKYMDGNVKTPNPGHMNPNVAWPGYGQPWYQRIVAETGTRYEEPNDQAVKMPTHRSPKLSL